MMAANAFGEAFERSEKKKLQFDSKN